MKTNKQMNAARKAVSQSVETNNDRSFLHQVAIDSLLSNGMDKRIVSEMAQSAMLDVLLGS